MKCPFCGNELEGKDFCSTCGKKVDIPEQEMEIEYKDFKISELLEIRKKQQKSHAKKAEGIALEETKKPNFLKQEARQVQHDKKKTFIIAAIVILLIIVFIAGAYYFLR